MATVAKFLMWHILCGAPIIIAIRLAMTLICLMFCVGYMTRIHMQFIQYALNPFGKKMIYTEGTFNLNGRAIPALLLTLPFLLISYFMHKVFQFISMIVSGGILNKYHQYMLDVHNGNMEIAIIDEIEKSPQQQIKPPPSMQKAKPIANSRNIIKYIQPTIESPPRYQDVIPSAPPPEYEESEENEIEGLGGNHELRIWLKTINDDYYSAYYQLFIENGYDEMKIVKTMSDQDLQQIGINKIGHRRNLMMEIQKLSNNITIQ